MEKKGLTKEFIVSVIIPAFNEERNIQHTLKSVLVYLKGKPYGYEVIVIDDGSSDETYSRSLEFGDNVKLYRNEKNMGKGGAIKRGIELAIGDYILFMDADNSTDIEEIEKFLPLITSDLDVVIGSRRAKGANVETPEPLIRIVMGWIYYMAASFLLIGKIVSEPNCGFKMYRAEIAKRLFSLLQLNDWVFDVELLYLIKRYNYRIAEVPVRWNHCSDSKVRPFKDGINSFIGLLKIKCNSIRGKYDKEE